MNTFYNFETKQTVNPLEKLEHFYVNPYMPENFRLLNMVEKIVDLADDKIITSCDAKGHIITLFPIDLLVKGDCSIRWITMDNFCINNSIWCKIVGGEKDIVRVDTVK